MKYHVGTDSVDGSSQNELPPSDMDNEKGAISSGYLIACSHEFRVPVLICVENSAI